MNFRSLHDAALDLRAGVARMAGLFPGSSLKFGPPRRQALSSEITGRASLIRHALVPARKAKRLAVEMADPPLDQWMSAPREAAIKEIVVCEIPRGRYWGQYHGYIIDRHDTLLTDLSLTYTPPGERHDALRHLKLPPVREMRGTVAVINTLYGTNYHHWLLDIVPRFEWIRRAGWHWSKIDHFIFPKKIKRFHLETLELLGLDPSKTSVSNPRVHIRADKLIVPAHSEPADLPLEYGYTPEGLAFVRQLVLQNNPHMERDYPRRIVISRERAKARRLVQGERTHAMLHELGFAKIFLEDHSIQEQAAMFHRADCIVMPTGGALANVVFCRRGATVIELFSPSYYPPFTYALAGELGLRYYGVVAEKIARPFPEARLGHEDIDVDPDRLLEIVRRALAQP
jgi:capsular polysaccharide biosynthesis protein